MQDCLKALAKCEDVAKLRPAIHALFAEFGEIAHMDILTMTQSGKRQALCFFQLESAAQEQRLMANLGVAQFGNELLVVVDLFTEQTNIAQQPEDSNDGQINRDGVDLHPGHDQNKNTGGRRFWLNPTRWSGTLLVAARRMLDRKTGWSNKGLVH